MMHLLQVRKYAKGFMCIIWFNTKTLLRRYYYCSHFTDGGLLFLSFELNNYYNGVKAHLCKRLKYLLIPQSIFSILTFLLPDVLSNQHMYNSVFYFFIQYSHKKLIFSVILIITRVIAIIYLIIS